MTTEDAIRRIMEVRGKRFMDVAADMDIATNTLSGRLKAKNISIGKLNEVLDVLDYKIVLMPNQKELSKYEFRIG